MAFTWIELVRGKDEFTASLSMELDGKHSLALFRFGPQHFGIYISISMYQRERMWYAAELVTRASAMGKRAMMQNRSEYAKREISLTLQCTLFAFYMILISHSKSLCETDWLTELSWVFSWWWTTKNPDVSTYWATRLSVRSFARTAYSLQCPISSCFDP